MATDYERGHVPGALHFDSDLLETGYPTWYLKPDAELQGVLESFGITADTTVIVYSGWQIAAARGWFALKYAGVEDVRFLDGGYAAWVDAGGAVETTDSLPVPVDDFGAVVPTHPEYLATTDDVLEHHASGGLVIDVRSWDEYTGEISGYDYIDAAGRISGAQWGQHCDDTSTDYLREDGRLRSPQEIEAIWAGLGADPEREVVVYCGGGWRSSLAFLYARLLGYDRVRNYSNGWSEWSTVYGPPPEYAQSPSGNPVATGVP
ncbi:MAG: rhodanese-like domain-containing protein [Myxococcota bacterium]